MQEDDVNLIIRDSLRKTMKGILMEPTFLNGLKQVIREISEEISKENGLKEHSDPSSHHESRKNALSQVLPSKDHIPAPGSSLPEIPLQNTAHHVVKTVRIRETPRKSVPKRSKVHKTTLTDTCTPPTTPRIRVPPQTPTRATPSREQVFRDIVYGISP